MRRKPRMLAAAAALLALALAGCTGTTGSGLPEQQPGGFSSDITARLKAAVTDAVTLSGSSAAVVGVWAPWAGSWTTAAGTTEIGGSTPVTQSMVYRIGQSTVPMTCTVLLELVDQGTVKLDDQVSKWIPGLVGVSGVTLRELCQSTSGIGDYAGQLHGEFQTNPTRQWPPLELASDGLAASRVGQPGEKFAWSLTNYVLVGMALENATNKSWPELYKQYVFDKLGMTASELPPAGQLTPTAAHPAGYVTSVDAKGQQQCDKPVDITRLSSSMGWTAGGVVSNLDDMKTFAQAVAGGSLLSDKSASAQMDGIANGASWQKYGLGVQLLGPLRGSTGSLPGYLSSAFADPSSGLTVVVMLNNSTAGGGFSQALVQRLASIVSKVPADQKGAKVVSALPWSEQQAVDVMKKAPCPTKEKKSGK